MATTTAKIPPLNPDVYRIHRFFFFLYLLVFLLLVVSAFATAVFVKASAGSAVLLLTFAVVVLGPLCVGHWYAAKGARIGLSYGRTLTWVLGAIMFAGVPVGTIVAIYLFIKTYSYSLKPPPLVDKAPTDT